MFNYYHGVGNSCPLGRKRERMKRFSDAVDHKMVPPDWIGCSGEHLEPVKLQLAAHWCGETCGLGWIKMGYDFWFKRAEDATMFKLKWS